MLPDLVADHDQVVLDRDVGDDLEFVRAEQPAGRIVRIVEQDRARLGRDRVGKRIAIDPPMRRLAAPLRAGPPRAPDHRRIAVVGRGEDDRLRRRARSWRGSSRPSASVAPLVTQTWSADRVAGRNGARNGPRSPAAAAAGRATAHIGWSPPSAPAQPRRGFPRASRNRESPGRG